MIFFVDINPEIISFGPFAIRYYSLAYIFGLIFGYMLTKKTDKYNVLPYNFDAVLSYVILGIILGGRLVYCFVYNLQFYLANPLEIFKVWHGGMSFHGGFIGFALAIALYCKRYKVKHIFAIFDLCAISAPIGLFLGRIANFINGELWGRVSDGSWGFVFFNDTSLTPRHPSQLYEAFFEGIILLIIMLILWKKTHLQRKSGVLSGIFISLYAVFRFIVEFFRQPDENLGYIFNCITMGQILCFIMLCFLGYLLLLGGIVEDHENLPFLY